MMVPQELIERILQQYGLKCIEIDAPQKGYRNQSYKLKLSGGQFANLILYKCEPGIVARVKNADYVSNYLADFGFPARKSIDNRIIKLSGGVYEKYGGLYNYLPGETIPWEAYTMEHTKQLGKTMSDMHSYLKSLPKNNLPDTSAEYQMLLQKMEHYFSQSGVKNAMAKKLNLDPPNLSKYHRTFKQLSTNTDMQPLHMDFVRGNILFDKNKTISGVLDFEKTSYGHISLDIARTLAFLLIDCKYKTESKIRKYFLHSGYNKRGKNIFHPDEKFEELVEFFLMHDFYKFLRHNPYEYLGQNEHFVRTRDYLQNRNMLTPIKDVKIALSR